LCCSIFREIWRHFNGSPLLCPINTTSSSSYVFRLRYPRVLHCRIVPIQMDYMTGHKSQKYNKYNVLSLVAVVANKRFVKILTPRPCHVAHEEFSRTCAWLLNYFFSILTGQLLWEDFFLSSATNVFNFWIGTIVHWSTLGYCNLNT
jgi:hypothetical protein